MIQIVAAMDPGAVRQARGAGSERSPGGKHARAIVERIAALLDEREQISTAEVIAATGLSAATAARYLRFMCGVGMLHLAVRHCTLPGSQHAALYGRGPRAVVLSHTGAAVRRGGAWQRGGAGRDPLVAALFGPARGQAVLEPDAMKCLFWEVHDDAR
ncbi:hypothetical protein AAKU55_002877 [Oxalobacteraceae bacterium GrIS 1.11]